VYIVSPITLLAELEGVANLQGEELGQGRIGKICI
jgi:hypothetical protein